ncbi:MAG: hypothetical protein ISR50_07260 [Alphaproteobacteria bacterium]|nr:hypothetical protein [Alphaproteobacteria bacterium]
MRFAAALTVAAALIALDAFYGPDSDHSVIAGIEYAGSAKCADCHKNIHDDYTRSGHPLKVQKIDGAPPTYPAGTSAGVPWPPAGMAWSDLSYIIGGYGWKARFMDREGYILTGNQERQYNLANAQLGLAAGWSGYDAKKAPRKPYTCGSCHVTGWRETGPEGPHQDGLPGIYGTWLEAGIGCEACHGPAAAHAANPRQAKLSTKPNCATCHIRGDVAEIDAKGGLVNHHEQYEELLASPHLANGCLACHDPHKSTKYTLGGFKGEQETCVKCHEDQRRVFLAESAHSGCISCHMPFTGKSAVATTITYNGGRVPKGDVRSHLSRIETAAGWKMFTDDGKFVRVDGKGRAALSLDYTCLGCHQTKDKAWATRKAARIHEGR